MQKTVIIFNPHADRKNAVEKKSEIQSVFNRNNIPFDWLESEYAGHSIELARQVVQNGTKKIIAIGGDGTVHEIINGIQKFPQPVRPDIGIIPLGSGNDFSFSLGIPHDLHAAIDIACNPASRPVDIGYVKQDQGVCEYWVNVIGIGFDAAIDIRSRKIPFLRGFAIYFLAALQTILLNHSPMQLEIINDCRVSQDELLMLVLANGRREGGGFYVAPDAYLNDKKLDYIAVAKISRLKMIYAIPFFLSGKAANLPFSMTGNFQLMHIKSKDPLVIHMDGEILAGFDSSVFEIEVGIVPGAVNIMVPLNSEAFQQVNYADVA